MIYFLLWTFILYWIHRSVHKIPVVRDYHWNHHNFINAEKHPNSWQWNNLFLFNDNWPSTLDLWLTEVIPSFLFSWITGQWWIMGFYYVWAAFIQESIEHNPKINLPFLTSGKWHLLHHKHRNKNFGLFFPLWDKLFKSEMRVI